MSISAFVELLTIPIPKPKREIAISSQCYFFVSPRDSFDGRRPLACTESCLRHIELLGDMNHEDSETEKSLCGFGDGVFLLINYPRGDVTRLGVCLNPQRG